MPSCPKGIPIPDILRFRMYYKNYGHQADAREYYAALPTGRNAGVIGLMAADMPVSAAAAEAW